MSAVAKEIKNPVDAALDLVDARLAAESKNHPHQPGLCAAVVRDQELLWSGGYGHADRENQTAITPQTVFGIGSITKAFTCIALLRLRDEGRLSLDDPVTKYLPEFLVKSPFGNPGPITLRQIMGHRSGLPMEAPLGMWDTLNFPDADTLLSSLREVELTCPPMTEYRYGNLAFAILGRVIERVVQRPYREYLRDEVLLPLGMTRTFFNREEPHQHAWGYATLHGGPVMRTPAPDARAYDSALLLRSTVEDLAKFLALQFRNGAPGEDVLCGSTVREMHWATHVYEGWNMAQATSWAIERVGNENIHRHSGSMFGFLATCSFSARLKFGLVILSNLGSAPIDQLRTDLNEILVPVFASEAARELPGEQPRLDADKLRQYAGNYAHPAGISVSFADANGRLVMLDSDAEGKQVGTLHYLAEHSFRVTEGVGVGEQVNFSFNGSALADKVTLGSFVFYRI